MVNFYIAKIRSGEMKLEDVPPLWKTQVAKKLK